MIQWFGVGFVSLSLLVQLSGPSHLQPRAAETTSATSGKPSVSSLISRRAGNSTIRMPISAPVTQLWRGNRVRWVDFWRTGWTGVAARRDE